MANVEYCIVPFETEIPDSGSAMMPTRKLNLNEEADKLLITKINQLISQGLATSLTPKEDITYTTLLEPQGITRGVALAIAASEEGGSGYLVYTEPPQDQQRRFISPSNLPEMHVIVYGEKDESRGVFVIHGAVTRRRGSLGAQIEQPALSAT